MRKDLFKRLIQKAIARSNHFWSRVDVRDPEECWEWQKTRIGDGYGHYKINILFPYRPIWSNLCMIMKAHRVAFLLTHRIEIPRGMFICHHCDNPSCCNPFHLFVGTPDDNSKDMVAKGRKRKGSKHAGSKMTEGLVLWIREQYATGLYSYPLLAKKASKKFGIDVRPHNVKTAVVGSTWLHVGGPISRKRTKRECGIASVLAKRRRKERLQTIF